MGAGGIAGGWDQTFAGMVSAQTGGLSVRIGKAGQFETDCLESPTRPIIISLRVGARLAQAVEIATAVPRYVRRNSEIEDRLGTLLHGTHWRHACAPHHGGI